MPDMNDQTLNALSNAGFGLVLLVVLYRLGLKLADGLIQKFDRIAAAAEREASALEKLAERRGSER